MGVNGAVIIEDGDTNTKTGDFFGILALTDVIIDEATLDEKIEGTINGLAIVQGSYIPLYFFSDISLTSGSAIIYRKTGQEIN